MKKYLSILSMCLLVMTFSACEDVPSPYEIDDNGGNKTTIFSETFQSSLGRFVNYTTDGDGEWICDYGTAKASGYDNASKVTTAGTYFLVSPEIDLTEVDSCYLTYDYIVRYNKGDENQQVLISTSFDSADPSVGWAVLNQKHKEGADWNTFSTAALDIPSQYLGQKIRIALRYYTNASSGSTWEVKNFKVMKGKAPENPDPTPVSDNIFDKTFDSSLEPFVNYTTAGEGAWVIDYSTAKATGYDNASKVTTAGTYYLVSPEIDLAEVEDAYVDYSYILMYNKGNENQQLLISTSFDENKPTEGWTLLNKDHTVGSSWTVFANSQVRIPVEFIGQKIRLAFYYNTNNVSGSTWEVKSVSVVEGTPVPKPNPGVGGTPDKPYTVGQLHDLFDAGTIPGDVVYTMGIVSKIDEINTSTYGNATYYISDDGSTANQFEVYRGYALAGAKFKSEDQLQVGDTVVVYGNVVEYGASKVREYTTGSKIYYSSRLGFENGDNPNPSDGKLPYTSSSLKDGFTSVALEGNQWSLGTSYAKASGYNNGKYTATRTWLVSPAINTKVTGNEGVYMKFDYVLRYVSDSTDIKNYHKVLVSADYNGVVSEAHWTVLDFDPIESPTQDWTFYSSNAITIPAEFLNKEKVYFAWYFECTSANSTTWELKNLSIKEGKPDDSGNEDLTGLTLADFNNGGFEKWIDDKTPELWKSTTTASSATLAKSTDAHGGSSFSVQVQGTTSANKRLASTELVLDAGTYNVRFYAKGDGGPASVRPGYVPVDSSGKVGTYAYGEYTNDLATDKWTEINHSFTLSAKTKVNLVIMNSKTPGGTVLIDDYTITKE